MYVRKIIGRSYCGDLVGGLDAFVLVDSYIGMNETLRSHSTRLVLRYGIDHDDGTSLAITRCSNII